MGTENKGLQRLYSLSLLRKIYHHNPLTKYWKSRTEKKLNRLVNQGKVMNGPFSGMNYPLTEARCSAFFPKITGSYEAELHPVFEKWKGIDFKEIVDIGCAEGYYASGLALRYKNAKAFAFDTDPLARELCRTLANSNQISESKLVIGEFCDPEKLKSIPFEKGLIVSDCEGYEIVLFTPEVVQHLKNCYVVIECHDNIEPETRKKLEKRFSSTHKISIVDSLPDFEKIKSYNYVDIPMSNFEKWYLYAERRGIDMEWLIMEPLNAN